MIPVHELVLAVDRGFISREEARGIFLSGLVQAGSVSFAPADGIVEDIPQPEADTRPPEEGV